MLTLICSRIVAATVTLLIVSAIVFAMVDVLPGDAATRILGREASPDAVETLRVQLALDRPPLERYFHWLRGFVTGDLGYSAATKQPISEIIGPRLKNTLLLCLIIISIYAPLVILVSSIQALFRDTLLDHCISFGTLAFISIPEFLLGTLILLLFVIVIPLFPATSVVTPKSSLGEFLLATALPSVTLAIVITGHAVRMLRDNLIEVLDSDYIKLATLKGMPRRHILLYHALPNSVIPTLNVTALNLGYLVGGVVIVEKVFSFPGFGTLLIDSLQFRDLPLIEAAVLIAAAIYIAANLLVDIGSMLLNPRLRGA